MKEEEFEKVYLPSGKVHYHNIEVGKKREEILKKRMNGQMTQSEFESEQKKMRNGKYLKMIYSEKQYLKAIGYYEN